MSNLKLIANDWSSELQRNEVAISFELESGNRAAKAFAKYALNFIFYNGSFRISVLYTRLRTVDCTI